MRQLAPASTAVLPISLSGQWRNQETAGAVVPTFSTKGKAEAEARFVIIEPLLFPERFAELWKECGGRKGTVIERIVSKARGEGKKICKKTIENWAASYRAGGVQGLARKVRDDAYICKKLSKADEEVLRAYAIPKTGVFGALTDAEIYRAFREERSWRESRIGKVLTGTTAEKYARFLDADGRLAEAARLSDFSARTLRRYVKEIIPEAARVMSREGEEKYQNTQEILSHRALGAIDPLEYLVCDHRLLDVFCRIPVRGGWRLARPWCTAAIDMRTRKWLGFGVFETPSSDSIACVLKKVLIEHGIPQKVYYDNGADYTCSYLEGEHIRSEKIPAAGEMDATWRGVLGALGIGVTHAIVRRARSKLIEPNFNRIAGIDKQLPEYCGHRPSARPERFGVMLKQHEAWMRGERPTPPFRTIEEIATFYDAAIESLNEREMQGGEGMRKHTATGYGWYSPNEIWEVLIPKIERRTVRIEDLHVVFSKRRTLTVRHGEIAVSFGGQKFYYRLENQTQLMALNGQLVEIAYDPHELGRVAIYWRSRFIGVGCCVELRKMGEDLFVEDEKGRRAARREVKRAIATVHQTFFVASPEERLARRREVAPVRMIEPPGVALQLPAPLAEASAAMAADSEFSFDACEAEIHGVEQIADISDGDEFNFFSDQGV